ncbi:MAG: hypothetical protein JWP44_4891 [Mucilaginibacter sp.]|nr:hypothetical protein [Mucilaginibacter sp.]
MGFRFSRRIRLFPGVRVNLSKSGASVSLGRRGAWITAGKRGTRATLGIPGTGLSYSESSPAPSQKTAGAGRGRLWWLVPVLLGALAVGMLTRYGG